MKRLNPDTGKPFVCGDVRADGFLFWGYVKTNVKKDGFFKENWLSPKVFNLKHAHQRQKYNKNKETICKNSAKWYAENKEKACKNNALWTASNPHIRNAINSKRRAAKMQRTPSWLTQEHLQQIESVYALAKQLTADTGIVHHVDHIVPLQGKTVSGLHVPWNLRAIPATENQSKSNKITVEVEQLSR